MDFSIFKGREVHFGYSNRCLFDLEGNEYPFIAYAIGAKTKKLAWELLNRKISLLISSTPGIIYIRFLANDPYIRLLISNKYLHELERL